MSHFETESSENILPKLPDTGLHETDQLINLENIKQDVEKSTADFDHRQADVIERIKTTLDVSSEVIQKIADQYGITAALDVLRKQLKNTGKVLIAAATLMSPSTTLLNKEVGSDENRTYSTSSLEEFEERSEDSVENVKYSINFFTDGIFDTLVDSGEDVEKILIEIAKKEPKAFHSIDSERLNYIISRVDNTQSLMRIMLEWIENRDLYLINVVVEILKKDLLMEKDKEEFEMKIEERILNTNLSNQIDLLQSIDFRTPEAKIRLLEKVIKKILEKAPQQSFELIPIIIDGKSELHDKALEKELYQYALPGLIESGDYETIKDAYPLFVEKFTEDELTKLFSVLFNQEDVLIVNFLSSCKEIISDSKLEGVRKSLVQHVMEEKKDLGSNQSIIIVNKLLETIINTYSKEELINVVIKYGLKHELTKARIIEALTKKYGPIEELQTQKQKIKENVEKLIKEDVSDALIIIPDTIAFFVQHENLGELIQRSLIHAVQIEGNYKMPLYYYDRYEKYLSDTEKKEILKQSLDMAFKRGDGETFLKYVEKYPGLYTEEEKKEKKVFFNELMERSVHLRGGLEELSLRVDRVLGKKVSFPIQKESLFTLINGMGTFTNFKHEIADRGKYIVGFEEELLPYRNSITIPLQDFINIVLSQDLHSVLEKQKKHYTYKNIFSLAHAVYRLMQKEKMSQRGAIEEVVTNLEKSRNIEIIGEKRDYIVIIHEEFKDQKSVVEDLIRKSGGKLENAQFFIGDEKANKKGLIKETALKAIREAKRDTTVIIMAHGSPSHIAFTENRADNMITGEVSDSRTINFGEFATAINENENPDIRFSLISNSCRSHEFVGSLLKKSDKMQTMITASNEGYNTLENKTINMTFFRKMLELSPEGGPFTLGDFIDNEHEFNFFGDPSMIIKRTDGGEEMDGKKIPQKAGYIEVGSAQNYDSAIV